MFIVAFWAFAYSQSVAQQVVINEFVAKNHSGIVDSDNDHSDWIELYNAGTVAINLENYSLSDDAGNLQKWSFPNITIAPNEFLLVFASGKNILDVNELHTNFKISSGGEALFLSDNSQAIISQSQAVQLNTDEAFGQVPDASGSWIKIAWPTPGASNNASNELLFSHNEGFYNAAFYLDIQSHLADSVFYTLNGELPHAGANLYTEPLFVDKVQKPNALSEIATTPDQSLISYPAWSAPSVTLDKAVVLRCASFKNGVQTSRVYTKSFFVDSAMFDKYTLPVISLVTENENLFDNDTGIYVPGAHYDANNPEWTGNYFGTGSDWERAVHISFFTQDGALGFAQDAGMRIHGGKTPHAAQKSLRLYARNKYGKELFNYPLFPQKSVDEYKRILLRTTMGDWQDAIISDVVAHDAVRQLDVDFQDFQPVIVYLNGEYWGIHTLRDRIDEYYVSYTHQIDKDSVEFSKDVPIAYQNLMDFVADNSLAVAANYEYVLSQINIENYIDYQIAEQFFANYDWPANNQAHWRKKNGGKWRWIFFDLDAAFISADMNMLEHCTADDPSVFWPNSPESTLLFRKLLENESFVTKFISRYVEVLSTRFRSATLLQKIDAIEQRYAPEITNHIQRWGHPNSPMEWASSVEHNLRSFVSERPCVVKENLIHFFGLPELDFPCDVDVQKTPKGSRLVIAPNPNHGSFYVYNGLSDVLDARITLTDLRGSATYFDQAGVNLTRGERFHINVNGLASNVYVLRVAATNYFSQLKVVVLQ